MICRIQCVITNSNPTERKNITRKVLNDGIRDVSCRGHSKHDIHDRPIFQEHLLMYNVYVYRVIKKVVSLYLSGNCCSSYFSIDREFYLFRRCISFHGSCSQTCLRTPVK